jgi:ABC-2 type transport system permease protein
MRDAGAIFKRDMRKFLGSLLMITMIFMFPLFIMVIFGHTMGSTLTHIPVGVTHEEFFQSNPLFTESVSAMQRDVLYAITVFPREVTAKEALKEGRIYAVVLFPDPTGNRSVLLYLDSSQYLVPDVLEKDISTKILKMDPRVSIKAIKVYGDIDYLQYFGVAVIVLAIFMSSLLGGGTSIIQDRELGILEGYFVTPVQRSRIIGGLIASGTVKAFFAGTFILGMSVLLAGVTIRSVDSFLSALFVIFLISLGLTSLVVSFAARFSNLMLYLSTVSFLNLILFMTSGAFYPSEGMPDWLVWVSWVNPETYSLHALRCIILKGQGLGYVMFDIVILSLLTVAAIILGILTFPRELDYYLSW